MKLVAKKTRAALREARKTYRHHRDAGKSQPEKPGPNGRRHLPALAERGRNGARRLRERGRTPGHRDDQDVVLDIPQVHVDEIDLQLDELKARVALEAHVLDLLRLDVGVDAELRGVSLKISGVDAEAHLRVRLENLTVILDRVMNTIDSNPQILEGLAAGLTEVGSRAASAVEEVGRDAAEITARASGENTT